MVTKYLVTTSGFAEWLLSAFPKEPPTFDGNLIYLVQREREWRDFQAIKSMSLEDLIHKTIEYATAIWALDEKTLSSEETNTIIYELVIHFLPEQATIANLSQIATILKRVLSWMQIVEKGFGDTGYFCH